MAPTATPQTIVISPDTRLVTIQNPVKMSRVEVTGTNNVPNLPKYAVGLFDSNGQGPRKRKRLTHLTPEEKIMRRKLKNRVAAQTARDRKKIRMECLEETINKVQEQAKQLLDVNIKLLERAEALERENSELKTRLGLTTETSSTVTQDRLDVERIKMEFDETMLSNDNANMSLPESLLSPDESSDENDSQGSLKRKVFDFQCLNDAKRQCLTTTERASSEPAVSGVHVLGRLNPQQQEAVKQTPIRSMVVMPVLTSLLHAPKRMKAKTSLGCSNKSMPVLIRMPSSEVSPQTNVRFLACYIATCNLCKLYAIYCKN
uniref:X-box-binding protein 1 n=1 Tax=Phallusia mammillata TaxID=59560 RepID=A0A6F9DWI5_9ASCI|nr:xBPa X-box-binding protein [Phallusia mammillata]